MSDLSDLYQEVILHHAKKPRNFGVLEDANRVADGHNPLCGDRLHLTLLTEDGLVKDLRFGGQGCAISTASASLMTEAVKGKTIEEAQALLCSFLAMVSGEEHPEGGAELPSKLEIFAGVREFPARVKCAMLSWRTLEAALAQPDTESDPSGATPAITTE